MMNAHRPTQRGMSVALMIVLAACGSGSVNVAPIVNIPPLPPLPAPPPTEAVSSLGVISALGSITMNGVLYQTGSTTVTTNGRPGSFSDLERGQIVVLEGTIEVEGPRGTANRVDYEATVLGPVENIDAGLGQLIVMGQTVLTNTDTIFHSSIDPSSFAGLTVGTNTQVSGFRNANGDIVATRVDPDTTSTGVQLIGSVEALDLGNMLFKLNRLTVDYSNATVIELPGGMPAPGMYVIARGALVNGILVVEEIISLYDSAGGTPGERTQAQGSVTRYGSATDFDLNGFPVTTNASTAYINGTINDLQANAEITVDGDLSGNGNSIVANEITFGSVLGPTATLTFDLRDFTEISVSTVFRVTATQGSDFSVQVSVDQDVASRVAVTRTGSTLNIGLLPGAGNIETLHAFVTMPALNSIVLTGVVVASVNDFNQAQMTVTVGGVSTLTGNELMIGSLTATVSGVSQLNFGDIRPIGIANIDVGGVSQGTLNMAVGGNLTGSVGTGQGSGVSTLFYYGTNITENVATDGLSQVIRLGDTKP